MNIIKIKCQSRVSEKNGGGGGNRTRVLLSLTIKDYMLRSILILSIPKYVIEFLHPPSPIDVQLDLGFSCFSTTQGTSVHRLYVLTDPIRCGVLRYSYFFSA